MALLLILIAIMIPVALEIAGIPNEIYLMDGSAQTLQIGLPLSMQLETGEDSVDVIKFNGNSLKDQNIYNLNEPLVISSEKAGSADVQMKLFGIIPVKNVTIKVVDEVNVIPGGQSIGVMLYTKGALVVGSMEIEDENGKKINPAKQAGLEPGDVIEQVDGVEIKNAAHLSELVNSTSSAQVKLQVNRKGETKQLAITPVKDGQDGAYKLGVWVRDSTAGVGTLTFYDPESKGFAGLGHAISDVDTGEQLTVKEGEIVESDIMEIVKGEEGEPGELRGAFDKNKEVIGHIRKNTSYGIYGTGEKEMTNHIYTKPIPAAGRDEVVEGPATLLCTVNDQGVQEYNCKIIKVNQQNYPSQKSFVVQIDDEKLLGLTGGIVQGMSGSPVIQNGKLIGAVTHVFVSDPTKGYGIYVDWMLAELYG